MHYTLLVATMIALVPFSPTYAASQDVYIKIDGVEGESTKSEATTSEPVRVQTAEPTVTTTVVTPSTTVVSPPIDTAARPSPTPADATATTTPEPQAASNDVFIKFDGVKGESTKGQAAEPTVLEIVPNAEPNTPDFGILLGGGSDDEEARARRQQVADILKSGLEEAGAPAEQVSLNYEKIKTKMKRTVKVLGFIPAVVTATVEIDAEERVEVQYPWWTFLASGKDADALGQQVFNALSSVLKSQRSTLMSIIGNVR